MHTTRPFLKTRCLLKRLLLGITLSATVGVVNSPNMAAYAQEQDTTVQEIANNFTKTKTMMGEFVQFGPQGGQTGGRFFIERPGRVLFLYEEPSNIRVVSDGSTLVVNNKKLDTWDTYPLSKTPLNLILGETIDLNNERVVDVRQEQDLTTIVIEDKRIFGNSQITMMFDPQTKDLRQWTIRDAQGKDTTVVIYNVKQGVTFGKGTFKIDYRRIQESKQRG